MLSVCTSRVCSEQLRSPQLLRSDQAGMINLGVLSGVTELRIERVGSANVTHVYGYVYWYLVRTSKECERLGKRTMLVKEYG